MWHVTCDMSGNVPTIHTHVYSVEVSDKFRVVEDLGIGLWKVFCASVSWSLCITFTFFFTGIRGSSIEHDVVYTCKHVSPTLACHRFTILMHCSRLNWKGLSPSTARIGAPAEAAAASWVHSQGSEALWASSVEEQGTETMEEVCAADEGAGTQS